MGWHNSIKVGRDRYFTAIKLEPCLKCHSEDLFVEYFQGYYWVKCKECGKWGAKKGNEVLARMSWNIREAKSNTPLNPTKGKVK